LAERREGAEIVTDHKITRRSLAPLAAGAAIAATASCGPNVSTVPQSRQFPADFKWGVATAAPQIEGAIDVDGRGPSIWDVQAKKPGKVIDHSDTSYGTDSYRRYKDDVALIAGANLKAYRFSIAWPRVMPEGAGAVNDKGIDYYKRLTDALHQSGIEPFATLFHWDLPQALQDKGGWANRDTAYRLADYAAIVADRLGDRIANFIILNEAAVNTVVGHVLGVGAPGHKGGDILGAVTHHQNLGQGLSMQAIRAHRPSAKVGTTMALMPMRPEGSWWNLRNDLPAYAFDALWNKAYLDPLFDGSYPMVFQSFVESVVKDGDMAITKQPVDFLGVNYYSPEYVKHDDANPGGIGPGVPPKGVELDAFGRQIDPTGIGECLERVRNEYGNPDVIITENGCSDPLGNGPGVIDDPFRIDYLRRHMEVVKAEMEKGSPVKGYFVWSLIDNWEWDSGFTAKFGMVAMNRTTGVRTPKKSYEWFAQLAKTGLLKGAA
jgi:beta-glucosidase